MPFSKNLIFTLCRTLSRLLPFGLLVTASHVYAAWTIVQADATVTVIHQAGIYQAEVGQRLALDDIVETLSGGGVQIQDDTVNTVNAVALGPDTQVLLKRDARIALLRGWVKVLHGCGVAKCATPIIETIDTRIMPGDAAVLVIASTPPGYEDTDAVFCETGTAVVLTLGNSSGKPLPVRLSTFGFAKRPRASETISVLNGPDNAFVTAMPVTFRDVLFPRSLPNRLLDAPPDNLRR